MHPVHTTSFHRTEPELEPTELSTKFGWKVTGGQATLSFSDKTSPRSGSYSASAAIKTANTKSWNIQLYSPFFTLKPGAAYTLQVWVRAAKPACSVELVMQGDATSRYEPYLKTFQSVAIKGWQDIHVSGYIPTVARPAQVIINLSKCMGPMYVDDITLFTT